MSALVSLEVSDSANAPPASSRGYELSLSVLVSGGCSSFPRCRRCLSAVIRQTSDSPACASSVCEAVALVIGVTINLVCCGCSWGFSSRPSPLSTEHIRTTFLCRDAAEPTVFRNVQRSGKSNLVSALLLSVTVQSVLGRFGEGGEVSALPVCTLISSCVVLSIFFNLQKTKIATSCVNTASGRHTFQFNKCYYMFQSLWNADSNQ